MSQLILTETLLT